jgi:hypothetical protein
MANCDDALDNANAVNELSVCKYCPISPLERASKS